MGPLSCSADQIVKFTDDPVVSIFCIPPGFFGAAGAGDNKKTR